MIGEDRLVNYFKYGSNKFLYYSRVSMKGGIPKGLSFPLAFGLYSLFVVTNACTPLIRSFLREIKL